MKVYELLARPEAWVQGTGGRSNSEGKTVAWCLLMAMYHCYGGYICKEVDLVRRRVDNNVVSWNDAPERTHAEVVALCKELDI